MSSKKMPLFLFHRLGREMWWQWGPDPQRNGSAQFLILHIGTGYPPAFRESVLQFIEAQRLNIAL